MMHTFQAWLCIFSTSLLNIGDMCNSRFVRIVNVSFIMTLLFSCSKRKKTEIQIMKSSGTTTDYRIEREFNLSAQELYDAFKLDSQ